MSTRARGSFDVTLTPEGPEDKTDGTTLGRFSIDKQFRGDLEGTSRGQMLSAVTSVEGSAGYVAIERVAGILQGRRGSFALQHEAVMSHGASVQTIRVVPDSSTDQLVGLTGRMTITVVEGLHSYELEYSIDATP
ncbi:MAG: DUF3224 domain-containing protein [Thermoplasmata archaeon]